MARTYTYEVGVKVTPEMLADLDEVARKESRSRAYLIREAVREFLARRAA